MPLARRLPKRGFHNIFGTTYAPVNVSALEKFEDGAEVTAEILCNAGIVKNALDGIKILGTGTLTKKLTVKAAAFSASAKGEDRSRRRKGRGGLRCFKPLKRLVYARTAQEDAVHSVHHPDLPLWFVHSGSVY